MALLKIKCPECNAGLKSPTGFTVGQNVCCPKCETYFAVDEPEEEEDAPRKRKPKAAADEEDEDEAPRKKKKRRRDEDDDDEGGSYKNSPLRYAILAVLVVIMLVLGYLLYEKNKREKANNAALAVPGSRFQVEDGANCLLPSTWNLERGTWNQERSSA